MGINAGGGREEILRQQLESALKMIGQLQARLTQLEEENKQLRARLGMNSRNSSKPPSSDGFDRPSTPRSLRQKTGRKPGKQPGGQGFGLAHVTDPDRVITHTPDTCSGCGNDLETFPVTGMSKRQVFDVPPIERVVTEHRSVEKVCVCGYRTRGVFPDSVSSSSVYGPGVRALGVYLLVRQHIPVARCAEMLADVLGVPVSTGWVAGMLEKTAPLAAEPLEIVRDVLASAPVVHCDETVCRVGGKNAYVHVASTKDVTLLYGPAKRSKEAFDAFGVLPGYQGVIVHDGYGVYRMYDTSHSLCNVHHLRELAGVSENTDQSWASGMSECLTRLHREVKDAKARGDTRLCQKVLDHHMACYAAVINEGITENPLPEGKRVKRSKARCLLDRLDGFRDDVLRFATDFRVPFDNNLAERDFRMVKIQTKISGGWRTPEGAKAFLAIRSYISTAIKHHQNPLAAITSLFTDTPWMPATH